MLNFMHRKKPLVPFKKEMLRGHRADYSPKHYFAFDGLIYQRIGPKIKYRREVKCLCIDSLKK